MGEDDMRNLSVPRSFLHEPALAVCSLAARGLFALLYFAADAEGRVAIPATVTVEEFLKSWAYDPFDAEEPDKSFKRLLAVGLIHLHETDIFVPARVGIAASGRAAEGVGSRGGKTSTERARERRERLRATGDATGCNGNAQRDATVSQPVACNGIATGVATENATGHMVAETTGNVSETASATGCNGDVQRNLATELPVASDRPGSPSLSPLAPPTLPSPAPPPLSPTSLPSYSLSTTVTAQARTRGDLRQGDEEPKAKAARPEKTDDLPHPAGSLAATLSDLLSTDAQLGTICPQPNRLAAILADRKTYPGIDPEREVRRASAWLFANPAQKKANGARFLTSWFSRAQESSRPAPDSQTPVSATPATPKIQTTGRVVIPINPAPGPRRTPEDYYRSIGKVQ